MSKSKGGVKMPIVEAVADGVKAAGKAVSDYQDNKTKRHVSDNEVGVKHHEIDSKDLEMRFNFVIRGFDSLISGVGAIGQTVNHSRQIKAELIKTQEQEKTKRDQALKELEKTKQEIELAREQAAHEHDQWKISYQTAVSGFQACWKKLFESVQSDDLSEQMRSDLLRQMSDLQKHIAEITGIALGNGTSK